MALESKGVPVVNDVTAKLSQRDVGLLTDFVKKIRGGTEGIFLELSYMKEHLGVLESVLDTLNREINSEEEAKRLGKKAKKCKKPEDFADRFGIDRNALIQPGLKSSGFEMSMMIALAEAAADEQIKNRCKCRKNDKKPAKPKKAKAVKKAALSKAKKAPHKKGK